MEEEQNSRVTLKATGKAAREEELDRQEKKGLWGEDGGGWADGGERTFEKEWGW